MWCPVCTVLNEPKGATQISGLLGTDQGLCLRLTRSEALASVVGCQGYILLDCKGPLGLPPFNKMSYWNGGALYVKGQSSISW